MILRFTVAFSATCVTLSPVLALGYYAGTHWR